MFVMLLRNVTVSCSSVQGLDVISLTLRPVKSKDHIKSEITCWVNRLLAGIIYFSFVSLFLYVAYTFCASCVTQSSTGLNLINLFNMKST